MTAVKWKAGSHTLLLRGSWKGSGLLKGVVYQALPF